MVVLGELPPTDREDRYGQIADLCEKSLVVVGILQGGTKLLERFMHGARLRGSRVQSNGLTTFRRTRIQTRPSRFFL